MIQTTQQTAKRWKGLQALGVLGILIGCGWWVSLLAIGQPERDTPLAVIAASFLVYLLARILAWWNHG